VDDDIIFWENCCELTNLIIDDLYNGDESTLDSRISLFSSYPCKAAFKQSVLYNALYIKKMTWQIHTALWRQTYANTETDI